MAVIHNPHDNFFKTSMSNLQIARSFFEQHLPAVIKKHLDLNTLELQPGTFIDKALQNSESDVLYKVKFRDSFEWAYLYVLAEHQSSVDIWMPLRLWQYIIAIWNECVKRNKKGKGKLPLVIPLVFYNGSKPYDGARDIRELIDAPSDLIECFLLKPFHLIDTHDIKDDDLKKQHVSSLMEFVMKHAFEKEAMNSIQHLTQFLLFHVGGKMLGDDYLTTVLKYYMSNAKTGDPAKLQAMFEEGLAGSQEGETMSTIASYLTQKGRQEGRQEALKEVRVSLLLDMLKVKFNDLSDAYIEKINGADASTLSQWCINLLNAKSLDEVFG